MGSREERRQLILEAAGRLFLAHGFGSTSMQKIAKEARISRAALYTYFGSKSEVFVGVIGFFISVITQSCEDALHAVGDGASLKEKLYAIFNARQQLLFVLDESQQSIFSFELDQHQRNLLNEQGAPPIQSLVKRIIEAAFASGELPRYADTPTTESIATSIWLGATAIVFSDGGREQKSEDLNTLLTVFSRGLSR